jgi:hypothetical protein
MTSPARPTPRALARVAAILYLVLAVCSGFGFFVRGRLIETGDAAATADHIRSSAVLFRASFVADLVGTTAFLLTAMALYALLHDVHRHVAGAMVTIVGVSVAIQCVNLLNQVTALSIATGHAYTAFGATARDLETLVYAERLQDGFFIAQVFFGAWLVPLGYLVVRSGLFPRVLGVLLNVAAAAYLIDTFVYFTARSAQKSVSSVTGLICAISEVAFLGWLLIKGVPSNDPAPRTSVPGTHDDREPVGTARHG